MSSNASVNVLEVRLFKLTKPSEDQIIDPRTPAWKASALSIQPLGLSRRDYRILMVSLLSGVHISWHEVFSKVLNEPSMVQK